METISVISSTDDSDDTISASFGPIDDDVVWQTPVAASFLITMIYH
jgi:hypothetical protein